MTGSSPRQPRDAFIPVIARIVERMESQRPSVRANWKAHPWFGRGVESATIELESLHVFGSFARGAPSCGDLDLIVSFTHSDGSRPPERVIHNLSCGRTRGLDVAIAHRNDLADKLERFPEAKLIWSPAEPDWRAHLARIPLDASAGRFERRTDQLPVSLKQIDFWNLEHVEKVQDAIERRELTSTWVPHAELAPTPEKWKPELQRVHSVYNERLGAKTRAVLPYVLQWMSGQLSWNIRLRYSIHDRAAIHLNGMFAHMGRPSLDVPLLKRADVSALVLAPHVSKRLPNGLWILTRGPRHPVVKAARALRAWTDGHGRTPLLTSVWPKDGYRVELAARFYRSTVRAGNGCIELRGHRLLDLIASVELVVVGRQQVNVTGQALDLVNKLEELLARSRTARAR